MIFLAAICAVLAGLAWTAKAIAPADSKKGEGSSVPIKQLKDLKERPSITVPKKVKAIPNRIGTALPEPPSPHPRPKEDQNRNHQKGES